MRRHVVYSIGFMLRDARVKLAAGSFIILLALVIMFSFGTVSRAGEQHGSEVAYESIRIQDGDTLWTISGKYMCSEFKDQKALVKEIKRLNHIGDANLIHEGGYLVVPVYR